MSMKTTGILFMAAAMTAMSFAAAPAMAQDRERTAAEAPAYPRGAERRGVEGYAVVEYTVNEAGEVTNPVVVEASPEGVFDRAVLRAIERWAYAPAATATDGMQQRFDFSLGG
ncbi:MAG: energy transducer TonB [Maricaulis sp.]|uniref:energy transducer TonB n=1 Tax=Maricaulis sp. TaxID=1486257 RepID=UPI0025BB0B67|nr:energy transducer TonB [Maricaulis sp.]MDM7984042.1 energy transducer TonB [Maricaulis sp.]